VITAVIPGADSSAGERRLVRLAALLAERAAVDLVAARAGPAVDQSARIGALRAAGVGVPFGGDAVHLVRVLVGRRYDLIVAESWEAAEIALPLVRRHQPATWFAVDTVDLHFLRDARAAEVMGAAGAGHEKNMARELDTYHSCDIRIFVTDVERDLYATFTGSKADHNVIIPIIVEPSIVPRQPHAGEVVFVGGLWHPPNWDGVFWFCSDVWPRVRAAVPEARFRLIGSNAWSLPIDTPTLAATPGVVVEGFVADLSAVYGHAAAVVAPVRFGAGMKGKVCEAMAAGVPVVTTAVGAEGIHAEAGRDLLVADGAEAFAAAVVALLVDAPQAAAIGAAGAGAIRAQCSPDVVRPAVHGLVIDAAAGPPPRLAGPATGTRELGRRLPRRVAAAGWRFKRRVQARRQQGGT
jgi:glycosyltransferase involved in cell wall biosynthesis